MEHQLTSLALYELMKESPKRSIDEKLQFMEKRVTSLVGFPDGERYFFNPSVRYFKSDIK